VPGIIPRRKTNQNITPSTTSMTLGEVATNSYDGRIFLRGNNGVDFVREIGVTAQRNLTWYDVSGISPVKNFEFDFESFLFSQGLGQSKGFICHVPASYISGTPIKLKLNQYSSGTSNNFRTQSVATLVRKGIDAVNSSSNQYSSTNGDQLIPSTQYQNLEIVYDLTDSSGKINNILVSPGDILKVTITRVTPTGTEDSNDVRVIPSSGEVIFS